VDAKVQKAKVKLAAARAFVPDGAIWLSQASDLKARRVAIAQT
jgi:hypothetical protein